MRDRIVKIRIGGCSISFDFYTDNHRLDFFSGLTSPFKTCRNSLRASSANATIFAARSVDPS